MKLSGIGRTWAHGGAWSSTPEHFVAEAVFLYNIFNAIGFAVRRLSDLGRRRGVVVHSLDDHSQKDKDSGDHRQSPWLFSSETLFIAVNGWSKGKPMDL